MDHFNATIHNGALVSTRRGLHVSKTKHQGTRFVNTFVTPESSAGSSQKKKKKKGKNTGSTGTTGPSDPSSQTQQHKTREFTFVTDDSIDKDEDGDWEEDSDEREDKKAKEPKGTSTAKASNSKARPKPKPKPKIKASTLASEPSTSSSSSSSAPASKPKPRSRAAAKKGQIRFANAMQTTGAALMSTDSSYAATATATNSLTTQGFFRKSPAAFYAPEAYKSHSYGHDLPEPYHKLMFLYMQFAPRYLYPDDELLTYNPVSNTVFFNRINASRATMQGIILIGTLIEAGQKGDASSDIVDKTTNTVLHYVNKRLQDNNMEIDLSVLESIAGMAMAGVSPLPLIRVHQELTVLQVLHWPLQPLADAYAWDTPCYRALGWSEAGIWPCRTKNTQVSNVPSSSTVL